LSSHFVVGFGGASVAGPFEDGVEALKRGDQATAARLLGPLAEKGNTRAQLALGVGPAVKGYRPPASGSISATQFEFILIAITAAASGIIYALKMREIRSRRARVAEFIRTLPPEVLAEAKAAKRVAAGRPWEPIAISLDSIQVTERGVRFRASGDHLGHTFGFAFALTISNGPVAICEWSRDGTRSEGLTDILAYYAGVPRGAIVLQAEPRNVPFTQIVRLQCNIFFELAKDNPEIYLDLDFAGRTGFIREKDSIYRKSLVHAFQISDDREEITP
jgi:hypothetical protein